MIQNSITFFQKQPARSYRLIAYQREAFHDDWKGMKHMHPHTEIMFITEGEGTVKGPYSDFYVKKGMIVVINPLVLHSIFSSTKKPMAFACFSAENLAFTPSNGSIEEEQTTDDSEEKEGEAKDKRDIFTFDFSAYYDELFDTLRLIEYEHSTRAPFWEIASLNEFDKLMLFILRKATLIPLPHESNEKASTISAVALYIRSRYTENVTLDKLADYFFMNKYYLSHAFKKKYDISPIQYLNQTRCRHANKMLFTTNLSITEVGISVGFNSITHFSETYKKFYGESPAQTRKKNTIPTPPPGNNEK